MLLATHTDEAIRERIARELSDVEIRFAAELVSDLDCVNELVRHVEQYRGKMLRPMLVLVSGLAVGSADLERQDGSNGSSSGLTDAHRVVATVMEMIHMATLVHDDVLDEADVRRQGATVNELRGNETAVMLGDYLVSHAYHLCSSINQPEISHAIAEATNVVCEGELLQLANRNNWLLDEGTYFEIIRRKTASLCGYSCRIAALLSGGSEPVIENMEAYGECLGVAFQIVDDLLDLVGDQANVGKTLGRDLQKGKLTLPLIHYLSSASESNRRTMLRLLHIASGESVEEVRGPGDSDHAAIREIERRLLEIDAIEYVRSRAAGFIEDAKSALRVLPSTSSRELLVKMAEAVITRNY